jgi:hypothetical protein
LASEKNWNQCNYDSGDAIEVGRGLAPIERGGYINERSTYAHPIRREPSSTGLYDVLDLILDKGIVIDVWIRVSLVGIELLTIDLRVVIASVDTYLRYAEGAQRLQLYARSGSKQLPDVVSSGIKKVSHGAPAQKLKDAGQKVGRIANDTKNRIEEKGRLAQRPQGSRLPQIARAAGALVGKNDRRYRKTG